MSAWLQEEKNGKAEETAALRGTISALDAQVATAQASISAAEDARLQASADCSRLRGDLEKSSAQRDEFQASAAALHSELSRSPSITRADMRHVQCSWDFVIETGPLHASQPKFEHRAMQQRWSSMCSDKRF